MTEAEVRHRLADLGHCQRGTLIREQSRKAGGRSDVGLPIPIGPLPTEVGTFMAGSLKKWNAGLPSLRKYWESTRSIEA